MISYQVAQVMARISVSLLLCSGMTNLLLLLTSYVILLLTSDNNQVFTSSCGVMSGHIVFSRLSIHKTCNSLFQATEPLKSRYLSQVSMALSRSIDPSDKMLPVCGSFTLQQSWSPFHTWIERDKLCVCLYVGGGVSAQRPTKFEPQVW